MTHTHLVPRVVCSAAWLLVACSFTAPRAHQPLLTEQEAIAIALQLSQEGPGLHIGKEEGPPRNVRAELMTFGTAQARLPGWAGVPAGDPTMMVWLVTMDGQWPSNSLGGDEGYHHLRLVLRATDGVPTMVSASP